MRMAIIGTIVGSFFLSFSAQAQSLPPKGLTSWTKKIQNRDRVAKVFSPRATSPKKYPLLVFLHGGNGNMDRTQQGTGVNLEPLAQRHGFVIVYPQGTSSKGDNKNHWNDGRGFNVGDNDVSEVDDVGFLNELVDDLVAKYSAIDSNQVYLAGVSNGGMMTMRVACESPQKFAGFGPMISSLPKSMMQKCQGPLGKPMLFLNGTEDRLVSYDGEDRRPFLLKGKLKTKNNLTVPQTVEFFAKKNQCQASKRESLNLPDRDKDDESTVVQYDYACPKQSPVRLYKVVGGGHNIPGGKLPKKRWMKKLIGAVNQDVDAAELLTRFLILD